MLDVIHRYKYQQALWFEPFLADLLVCQAAVVLVREVLDDCPRPAACGEAARSRIQLAERLAARLGCATAHSAEHLTARLRSPPKRRPG